MLLFGNGEGFVGGFLFFRVLKRLKRLRLDSSWRLALFLSFVCVCLPLCNAQDPAGLEQGIKPYGTYHGGNLDSVSLVNGGLTLHVPLASLPQRGGELSMTFSINYNQPSLLPQGHPVCPNLNELSACYVDDVVYSLQMPPRQFGGPLPNSGSYGIQIVPDFYPQLYPNFRTASAAYCNTSGATPPPGSCVGPLVLVDYVLTDADGAGHHLGPLQGNGGNSWFSKDSTGYSLNLSNAKWIDKSGIQYQGTSTPVNSSSNVNLSAICCGPPISIEDPNGNKITTDYSPSVTPGDPAGTTYATGWTDTMGRFVPLPIANTGAGASTATSDFTNCSGTMATTGAYLWTIPGPNGATSQFKICYASFPYTAVTVPICTNSPSLCDPFPSSTPTATIQIQSIVLPNLTAWTFAYNTSGLLSQLTLPTGGTIRYTWGLNGSCTGPAYGSVFPLYHYFVTSRTVSDSTGNHTWTYSGNGFVNDMTSPPSGIINLGGQTVVTDPLGNDAVHTISDLGSACTNLYDTEIDQYSGSHTSGTLLETTKTAYSEIPDPTPFDFTWITGTPAMNVVPQSVTTTDVQSGLTKETAKSYDSGVALSLGVSAVIGVVTQENEYDFGSGATGPLLRQTNTAYMALSGPNAASYFANNMLNLPYTVQVVNGSGAQESFKQYNYDETTLAASGLAASSSFDGSPATGTYRGNNTSVWRALNLGSAYCVNGSSPSSNNSVTQVSYYDTGMADVSTDPCGHTTTTQYASQLQYAYPTKVTDAYGGVEEAWYDFNTGLKVKSRDVNHQQTTYGYDSSARLTSVGYPDGGAVSYCYSDSSPTQCTGAVSSPSVLFTKVQTPNVPEQIELDVDGYGRKIKESILSDTQTDYIDTKYDPLGRLHSVSNLYRYTSDPTYGVTTYAYDALNRKTGETEADGSALRWCYNGVATIGQTICQTNRSSMTSLSWVDSVDEVGNPSQQVTDGIGRLRAVLESLPITPSLGMETDYSYDVLGNLLGVVQNGSTGDAPRTRSFQYDSLSRLVWAQNPENGVTCYGQGDGTTSGCQPNGYDADGNLIYKTDARGVVTNYSYDSLHHLTSKSYPGALQANSTAAAIAAATPSSTYVYGAVTATGNTAERLVGEFTGSQGAPITQRTVPQYDAMGRIQQDTQCATITGCAATPYALSYQYDAAGNPYTSTTGVTNLGSVSGAPAGINLTYAYDGVARLTTVTSNWDDANHPGQIFAPASSIAQYGPAGLVAALFGVSSSSQQPSFGQARTYDNRMRILSETDQGYGTGAPASGWINFDGGDGGTTGPHPHCPIETGCQLIPDTGTITITLTSPTEVFNASVDYQGESASDLATELAQALTTYDNNNNPPMVSATTSGSTLTMTALVTGSAGQYAVSVSESNQSNPGADDYDNMGSGNLTVGVDGLLGANPVYSYSLNYAANSNVASVTDSVMGTWNYSYDSLNRLTSAQASANVQTGFAPYGTALLGWGYDSFGNYLGETLSGSTSFSMPQVNYTYSGQNYQNWASTGTINNRIDGVNYDAVGNIITDLQGNNYTYDAENRVLAAGGTSYLYDAGGNRVAKLSGAGVTEQYLLGLSGEQAAELDGSGNWQRTYVYGAGKELAKYDPNGVHFDFTDWLGTRRMQGAGITGLAEETCTSLPFGDSLYCLGANGQPNSDQYGHHFTGKERDAESGLDYFGARYYGSSMGRFMSADWAAKEEPVPYAKLDDPQSLNLYSYVYNNPLSKADPDGHDPCWCSLLAGKIEDAFDSIPISITWHPGNQIMGPFPVVLFPKTGNAPAPAAPVRKADQTPVPTGLVGTDPKPTKGRTNSGPLAPEHGGSGDAGKDFGTLTGGKSGPAPPGSTLPPGTQVGENGTQLRPGTSTSGPRIDIPSNGSKPIETLHYPPPPPPPPTPTPVKP